MWDRDRVFTAFWAHDSAAERQLTEELTEELLQRWQADPAMHVYHYAPYERTALGRLTGRHGVERSNWTGCYAPSGWWTSTR